MSDVLSAGFDQAPAAMVVVDSQGCIVAINQAFTALTGYGNERLIGRLPVFLRCSRHNSAFYETAWAELKAVGRWSGEAWVRHASGRLFAIESRVTTVCDPQGGITNHVAVLNDITARKRDEERDRRASHADPLTGLPDRAIFLDRLDRVCARCRRSGELAMVAYINVDWLGAINGTYGFDAGDALLREMARRLRSFVRDSDTVARFDGDGFAAIYPAVAHRSDTGLIARKLLAGMSDTYELAPHRRAFVSVSVGLALAPDDGLTGDELVKSAEIALFQAKAAGRNVYRFHTEHMNFELAARLQFEQDLHEALVERQFELHFLPIVDAQSGGLLGAEALIRWRRPGQGLVAPMDFLPLAEETGLIVPIGGWVLEEVVDTLIAAKLAAAPPVRISVNISPRQLRQSETFDKIRHRLRAASIAPSCLELEISESALAEITRAEEEVLRALAEFGIGLSIDNYGTGYTSLQHLRRLPVKLLKIDKLFLRNASANADDTVLAEAIARLAKSLGIQILAEGVETAEQWRRMQDLSFDFGQGYYFSRPLATDEFLAFARQFNGREEAVVQGGLRYSSNGA